MGRGVGRFLSVGFLGVLLLRYFPLSLSRCVCVCVKWMGADGVQLCMIYASTKEQLKNALDIKLSIHADSLDEIEWKSVLNVASGGKV